MEFGGSSASARSAAWKARSSARAISSPSNFRASGAVVSKGRLSRAGCAPISLLVPRSTDSSGSCSNPSGLRQVDMKALLLLLPVASGLLLWWVSRNDKDRKEHTSELQSLTNLVCRLLLEKKKNANNKR